MDRLSIVEEAQSASQDPINLKSSFPESLLPAFITLNLHVDGFDQKLWHPSQRTYKLDCRSKIRFYNAKNIFLHPLGVESQ